MLGAGPGGGQLRALLLLRSMTELPVGSTEDWVRSPFAGRAQNLPLSEACSDQYLREVSSKPVLLQILEGAK